MADDKKKLVEWTKDNGDKVKLNTDPNTEAKAKELGWKKGK